MNLLFYINWRAFNIGKQKGYFLENIFLLMSAKIFAFIGCMFIVFEWLFNLNIRQHLFNIRSENATEKLLGISVLLVCGFLIFKILKGYYTKDNKYQKIIKEYDVKYKKQTLIFFLFYS